MRTISETTQKVLEILNSKKRRLSKSTTNIQMKMKNEPVETSPKTSNQKAVANIARSIKRKMNQLILQIFHLTKQQQIIKRESKKNELTS